MHKIRMNSTCLIRLTLLSLVRVFYVLYTYCQIHVYEIPFNLLEATVIFDFSLIHTCICAALDFD